VVSEAQRLVGQPVHRIAAIDALTVVVGTVGTRDAELLVSADAAHCRAHLVSRRSPGIKPPPPFVAALRKHLEEANVVFVRQRGLDRILEVGFFGPQGDFALVAELMGKHANVMLIDPGGRVVAAMKWVGPSRSRRPILPNRPYDPPPFPARPSLLEAQPGDDLSQFEGGSPFLVKLVAAGTPLETVQSALRERRFEPVYAEGHGAYPLPLSPLGIEAVPRSTYSQALEQHASGTIAVESLDSARRDLTGQLRRVLLARELAEAELSQALDTAGRAGELQWQATMLLSSLHHVPEGAERFETFAEDGSAMTVRLDPDLTAKENAERIFDRARRAKARAGEVGEQRARMANDVAALTDLLGRLERATETAEVEAVRQEAERRRWTLKAAPPGRTKEERPYEGHSIRETLSPGGWRVLYGENATSNDYLTLRVARPRDLWFHVRGAPSAHVVLVTNNQPERVQAADIRFAAALAVRHSPSKHAGYVAVDWTQKRHVRKPKGAAPGTVLYTNEKTIHLDSPNR
jgi:predicted ribosome quality control (RQC) complex YloA/Tae2 family protein